MKKVTLCLMVLLGTMATQAQWGKKINGNGKMTTVERSTGDYDGVAVSGSFDVILVAGQEGQVTVEGEENLLEYVITEVKNGNLEIRTERGVQLRPSTWKHGITITVPVQEIDNLALSGSGDISTKTTLKSRNFNTQLSGSGDVSIDVEATEVKAALSGSGDLSLNGKATNLVIEVSGSGDVDAYGLDASFVECNVSGSADVNVSVDQTLRARVSGSGDIHYRGNPKKIDSKTIGSGGVSKG